MCAREIRTRRCFALRFDNSHRMMRALVAVARARWIIVACALIAASAFALSVWVGAWWSIGDVGGGDVTIGPLGSYACFNGECRPRGLAWLGASSEWERAAFATGAVGLLAMTLCVVLAAALAARRTPVLVAKTTLVAVATALACGGYVVAKFPPLPAARLDVGALLFVVAIVLGAVASVLALRAAAARA
jgi:hypothetical protein